MLRVWPAQGAQRSAESTSFLKVDPRKKQVTLYDPAAGPPGSAGPRRAATTSVPKMFAFDAVFPQDSEQVRAVLSWGLGAASSGPGGQSQEAQSCGAE